MEGNTLFEEFVAFQNRKTALHSQAKKSSNKRMEGMKLQENDEDIKDVELLIGNEGLKKPTSERKNSREPRAAKQSQPVANESHESSLDAVSPLKLSSVEKVAPTFIRFQLCSFVIDVWHADFTAPCGCWRWCFWVQAR